MRVERMRQAILQGRALDQVFAKPTLQHGGMGSSSGDHYNQMYPSGGAYEFIPAGMSQQSRQHHHHQQQQYGPPQAGPMGRVSGGRGRGLLGE